jgi:hypothetical protein
LEKAYDRMNVNLISQSNSIVKKLLIITISRRLIDFNELLWDYFKKLSTDIQINKWGIWEKIFITQNQQ